MGTENQRKIERGNIYYVKASNDMVGCEMGGTRPAIIVSNDQCNENSSVVEAVYLTTALKNPIPTHVPITSSPKPSIAMCEQVDSVSVTRLESLVGRATQEEMKQIDKALACSLGITECPEVPKRPMTPEERQMSMYIEQARLAVERDLYKKMYEDLYRLLREMNMKVVV